MFTIYRANCPFKFDNWSVWIFKVILFYFLVFENRPIVFFKGISDKGPLASPISWSWNSSWILNRPSYMNGLILSLWFGVKVCLVQCFFCELRVQQVMFVVTCHLHKSINIMIFILYNLRSLPDSRFKYLINSLRSYLSTIPTLILTFY